MAVDQNEVNAVKDILWQDEKVVMTVKQRRVGPGGSVTVPTSVLATDHRLIIVNKATLGIRKDYETIPYRQISSVRLEHGIISSSVFVRVQGYDKDQGLLKNGKEEGEIDGLNNTDAKALADYINQILSHTQQDQGEILSHDQAGGPSVFCSKCGARNEQGSRFCSKCGARIAG
ncbi:MAG: PH domain-containing protein [Candidatus Marsarchaeota archaeon]|jgi:hypothetical protein|nr:PH domain-containing protein [Candidatus Marsarchaeota archaeon]MCL5111332.1 PH domain-containing protein [Candidatus Marsarchaeota archaeon]